MRIAITADPYIPVPPVTYGGIERVVDFLVRGLAARGHSVTLVAHPGSRVPAATLVGYGCAPHAGVWPRGVELAQVGSALWQHRHDLDLVHSFGRLAALMPVLPVRRLAKVQSYQRDAVPWRSVRRATQVARESILFTGCSSSVYRLRPSLDHSEWRTVFNGVDLERYTPVSAVAADAPLMFLGRVEAIKGTHHAIEIARRSGRRLVIAGNHATAGPHADYFTTRVLPHVDGEWVTFVGPVDDQAKNRLLGQAAALLMPIEWQEPFGIVMAEALACGTPVIGFRAGAVPEVVRDGANGFVCDGVEQAVAAVSRVRQLDRAAIRRDCEARFGAPVIVAAYEALYAEVLERVSRPDVSRQRRGAVHA